MAAPSPDPQSLVLAPVSDWVQRWSHLIPPHSTVLDIACGSGRHMRWLAERGHTVTGVDRSAQALLTAANFGATVLADIESQPWPLMSGSQVRQFDGVLVTNYLWRALFSTINQSLAPGGVLIYETFTQGNETVGQPSRPDFLLQTAELLSAFASLRLVAFEEGFVDRPARFVQRIAAVRADLPASNQPTPARYTL